MKKKMAKEESREDREDDITQADMGGEKNFQTVHAEGGKIWLLPYTHIRLVCPLILAGPTTPCHPGRPRTRTLASDNCNSRIVISPNHQISDGPW